MRSRLSSTLVVCVLLPAAADGQVHKLWTFEELRATSDLVVIAAPGETRETGTRTVLRELEPGLPVVEIETEFKVLSVLKGELTGQDSLRLRHYRLDWDRIGSGCINCGSLVEFSPTAPTTRACRAGDTSPELPSRCDYLLFLKRANGALAPTSGDAFAGSSVFLLSPAN